MQLPNSAGTITGLDAVLVDGDDMNEPVAGAVRSILDRPVVLSRQLAAAHGQLLSFDGCRIGGVTHPALAHSVRGAHLCDHACGRGRTNFEQLACTVTVRR